LVIEEVLYSKMIIKDVNNYIAIYDDHTSENPHLKLKGCFEIDKEYYKDPSMRIVPIALKEYFVNGVPIRDTILNHKDIYDFCLRLKTNSKSIPIYTYVDSKTKKVCNKILDRTTRYYISNKGGYLCKQFKENNNKVGVNIGYTATLFNKFVEKDNFKDYNINYQFYIAEAMKIVDAIVEKNTLSLFD
jgi:hypothetical protein